MGANETRMMLALAVVFGAFIPGWALLLWLARSSRPWRWARKTPRTWFAFNCSLAAFTLATFLFAAVRVGWMYEGVLWYVRRAHLRAMIAALSIHAMLFTVAWVWLRERRGNAHGGVPPPVPARPKLTPGIVLIVLLGWIALAGAFAFLRFGPLATTPASDVDLKLLTASGAVIFVLIVILLNVARDHARRRRSGREVIVESEPRTFFGSDERPSSRRTIPDDPGE